VNLFDLAVILLAIAAAVGGYRIGFVARVFSWVGLGLGIVVAALLLPELLSIFPEGDEITRLVIVGGSFFLIASLGGALGFSAGAYIRRAIPFGAPRHIDKWAGAVAGVVGTFVFLWLLFPAISEVPGDVSRQARSSSIARALNEFGPRAPESMQALREFVRDVNFPEVFADLRPSPSTGVPPAQVLSADVQARVAASTVLVSGSACGRIMVGSGFSPEPNVIVTNAHVVAGVRNVSVERPDGRRLSARVQVFDPNRDLAVLSVSGLGEAALTIGDAPSGMEGAVFGHPGGQVDLEVSPARIAERINALGRDIYGSSSTRREVFILAAQLAPGDSGGPLVDRSGTVVGVAFAIAPDRPGTAYALTRKELREALEAPRAASTSTGSCVE
jgi:S1-C subfamily serine protease